jgi:hypothetical protein
VQKRRNRIFLPENIAVMIGVGNNEVGRDDDFLMLKMPVQ